jgi:2-desacetyl-2-hydroxyethyl bacteriochlorophyllide A dehydrogenase
VIRRALTFVAPQVVEVRDETLPPPGAGEALVATRLSAISPGTEMLVYRGQAPEAMAIDATIAALEGAFRFPLKFGYAAVGRITAVGPGVADDWLGRDVFAFNPHESHFVAPVTTLIPLPSGISLDAAIFLPNVETAVSFLMDGRPVIGERVVVVGQGVVGLLTTALLSAMPLADLTVVEPLPGRQAWARRLGATAALTPQAAAGNIGGAADLIYELSGRPEGLDLAIALTGDYGRVVIGSWYGRKRVELDLGGRFHRAHIRLIGTQVSHLAPAWRGRWTKERRLAVAWEMIRRQRPEQLITHRLPIGRAAEAYALLDERPDEALQVVFTYD